MIFLVVMGLSATSIPVLTNESLAQTPNNSSSKKASADYSRLIGSWVRLDGGYVIEIRKIHPDGKVDAAYLNPRPINVDKATVSEIDGTLGLFIRLQDQGYPGSTYALKYNSEYDVLVGVYFQAAIQQMFEVIFKKK